MALNKYGEYIYCYCAARQGLKGRNIIAQVVRPGFAIFPLNSGLKGRHIVGDICSGFNKTSLIVPTLQAGD